MATNFCGQINKFHHLYSSHWHFEKDWKIATLISAMNLLTLVGRNLVSFSLIQYLWSLFL